jgi:hypothetical protein
LEDKVADCVIRLKRIIEKDYTWVYAEFVWHGIGTSGGIIIHFTFHKLDENF